MKWPHDKRQGLAYALLLLSAWVQDHQDTLAIAGYWLLIALALVCDAALVWLAVQSAHVGPA